MVEDRTLSWARLGLAAFFGLMVACDPGAPTGGTDGGTTADGAVSTCEEGERRCGPGASIEECRDGAYTSVASCAVSCEEGRCGTQSECSGSESRCSGNDREQCVGGRFVTQETCAEGCSAGTCLSGPCTDGTRRCNGLVLEECSGEVFAQVEVCGAACVAEACAECASGATRCEGSDLQTCSGGAFSRTETCTYGCAAGACNPAPCVDGARMCVDGSVHTCTGGAFALTETCSGGCSAGACTAGCAAGARRCTDNQVERCDGDMWQIVEACAFACSAGACTSDVTCTPGASRCNGSVSEICNATGTAYLHLATCPVSCTSGLCDGTCSAGRRRCNGATLEQCSTDGTSWDVAETCGVFCEPVSATCAYSGLEIATNRDLEGDVIVDGAFILRSGTTLTTRTGNLTIRASSITIELGASVVSSAISDSPASADRGAYSSTSSCSALRAGRPGQPIHTLTDALVGPGGRGGRGGTYYTSDVGGVGGRGGGVIRLIANDFISIAGAVRADGATGGAGTGTRAGGGGGGAGGGILVVAPTLDVTGTLSARGGNGGTAPSCITQNGEPGVNGFIKTFSNAEGAIPAATIDGQHVRGQRPPLTITSSTHPDQSLVYNDGFDRAVFTWSRPFDVTGYFHTLNRTLTAVPTSATGRFAELELAAWDRADLSAGTNYFHIVPINAMSLPGTIQNYFRVTVNTTPPNTTSTSHPSASTWYASVNPFFQWTLPHDARNYRGFLYVLNQTGDTVPDATATWLDVSQQQILLSGISPGVHMFHIVSVDQQGYLTRAAHHVRVNVGPDPGVGTVYGRVRAMDGSDLAGALVTINRGLLTATNPDQTTNATGNYNHMGVPAGTWEIRATRTGYAPATGMVTVEAGSMHAIDLNLSPLP